MEYFCIVCDALALTQTNGVSTCSQCRKVVCQRCLAETLESCVAKPEK